MEKSGADMRAEIMDIIERLMVMWNSHDCSRAGEIYARDYRGLDITDASRVTGPGGVAKQLERFYRAFPDLKFQPEETILENNRVALYWSASGTHQGTLLNIPPSGRRVHVHGVSMLRIENSRIVRGVHLWDMAALLRAIGLLPELEKRAPIDPIDLKSALTICE